MTKPDTPFDYEFPYPSRRMPVMARNMVATSQPLAVQAGVEVMQDGGNAADAALAAAITLTIVEPTSNGIGSDAFALIWDGEKLHGLNASGRMPAAATPGDYSGQGEMPLFGWPAVTVPGAVSAWSTISEKFGKLPFGRLFERAINYARNGYCVSPITASAWAAAPPELAEQEGFGSFLPGGQAPAPGQLFRFPDQASTLEAIAASNGKAFYQGELAQAMVASSKRGGGKLTLDDLASHHADWVEPIQTRYRDIALHEIPPNGQGLAALICLGILRHCTLAQYPLDSADSVHVQIEAMKLAFADTYRHVSDPATMEIGVDALLEEDYLASRAGQISLDEARDPGPGLTERGGTVYLSTGDQDGMMVSMIQSNYAGFGSGIVVEGTGISLQNRGAGFNLVDGHPNQVDGGKRPFHTIIPGFLTRDGKPEMAFGVMGGSMQPQGHAQMVVRMYDYGQNPQAASDAPRWRITEQQQVDLEPGFDPQVKTELVKRGHRIFEGDTNMAFGFGGAQFVYRTRHGYIGASDHRKDGMAMGF